MECMLLFFLEVALTNFSPLLFLVIFFVPSSSPRFLPSPIKQGFLFRGGGSSLNNGVPLEQEEVMLNHHTQKTLIPPVTGPGTGTGRRLSELKSECPTSPFPTTKEETESSAAIAGGTTPFDLPLRPPLQSASSQSTSPPPSSVPEKHWWSCCFWPLFWSCWPCGGCLGCSRGPASLVVE
ncbi:MAG: hypothetical protein JOS17DRAFT_734174 [Linnemannia elongata]|nr:MAG: hypothetical protein JOS17DRAFT_734174 [Linnemannia elongata]